MFRARLWLRCFGWMAMVVMSVGLMVPACNFWIVRCTRGRVFDSVDAVPSRDVGLVLGTGKTNSDGRWGNPHFENRIRAAAALYRAAKLKRLLVSGDNH